MSFEKIKLDGAPISARRSNTGAPFDMTAPVDTVTDTDYPATGSGQFQEGRRHFLTPF